MTQIVPLREEHLESFRECLDAVARERRYLALVEAPPLEQVRAFREMVAAGNGVDLVALDGDRVVGWCDVVRKAFPGFTHSGTLGMGLLAAYRGRGIGRTLVQRALNDARAAGIERVELEVFASNASAIALYESLGFEREGVKRGARKIDGIIDDIICMAIGE